MAWWNKKSAEQPALPAAAQAAPPPIVVEPAQVNVPAMVYDAFAANAAMLGAYNMAEAEVKNFDWNHYNAMTSGIGGMFASEFNLIPTMRILKGMYIQEGWINNCTNAIMRQFLGAKFLLKMQQTGDGQQQTIAKHPLLEYLRDAGKEIESSAFFTSNGIMDLILCGNAYWWNDPVLGEKRRLPAERVDPVVENNRIVRYRMLDRGENAGSTKMSFLPEEITHIKMPNPFSPHIGMSMIIATTVPVLIEKYGCEYVIGFFLRGGQTAGIIETKTSNVDQLMRLARSIMQAFGGRKNMHSDKILPDGATWKGQGGSFADIRLIEMLKDNVGKFRAATGCTNTVLGIVENVNRATAQAEMELFWKLTIEPLQKLWCAGIMGSAIWERFGLDNRYELCFDNSQVEWLDDFERRLDQDAKLAPTWTINERRERLGKKPMTRFSDKLQSEVSAALAPQAFSFAFAQPEKAVPVLELPPPAPPSDPVAEWKANEEAIQEPTKSAIALFGKEFGAWEQIVLDNIENKDAAVKKIRARGDAFANDISAKMLEPAMKAYKHQQKHVVDRAKSLRSGIMTKESAEDRAAKLKLLEQRARQVVEGKILTAGKTNFLGYSDTAMDSIYDFITAEFESGKSLADVSSSVRTKFSESYSFDEAYKGQAETIVRTEFGAAISIGQAEFGKDLATMATKMTKGWVTLSDTYVRDTHIECEDQGPIEGDSDQVIDAVFVNGLRYPREAGAPAKEVINCRCTIRYDVIEWTED